MKKYKFKFVALLVAVALMLPNFTGAGALVENQVGDERSTIEEMEALCALQDDAIKAYRSIMNHWRNEEQNVIYPNTYGGSYITVDNRLAVKLVNNDQALREEITSIVKDPNILVFESTDISLTNLKELAYNAKDSLDSQYKINSIVIHQKTSTVDVSVVPSDVSLYSSPVEIDPHIVISLEEPLEQFWNCISGVEIDTSTSTTQVSASMGWCGKFKFIGEKDYKKCFLTAGHVIRSAKADKASIKYNNTTIFNYNDMSDNSGVCRTSFAYGDIQPTSTTTIGDYAFLYSSLMTPSNLCKYGTSNIQINGWLTDPENQLPDEAKVIKAYGKSGVKEGKISGYSVYTTFENNVGGVVYSDTVYGLIEVDWKDGTVPFARPGDSGCTVYYNDGSQNVLCGIITGGTVDIKVGKTYFTPIDLICDTGFIPYPYTNGYNG